MECVQELSFRFDGLVRLSDVFPLCDLYSNCVFPLILRFRFTKETDTIVVILQCLKMFVELVKIPNNNVVLVIFLPV